MTAEMAYGALSAKVRALYGKRLRSDDFARLAARRSEAEILDELLTKWEEMGYSFASLEDLPDAADL